MTKIQVDFFFSVLLGTKSSHRRKSGTPATLPFLGGNNTSHYCQPVWQHIFVYLIFHIEMFQSGNKKKKMSASTLASRQHILPVTTNLWIYLLEKLTGSWQGVRNIFQCQHTDDKLCRRCIEQVMCHCHVCLASWPVCVSVCVCVLILVAAVVSIHRQWVYHLSRILSE